jgi:hypothetical protein
MSLLHCIREPLQRDPPKQSPVTFMQGPPRRASLKSSSAANSASLNTYTYRDYRGDALRPGLGLCPLQ